MEGCPKTLMISFDIKEPATADFTQPLSSYIQDYYQENADSYKNEIQQINQLKKSISGISRDNQGCSTLRRYFAQLHFLESRFPMGEGGAAAVPFVWYDVYMGDPWMRKDIRYEQACVLFNLGGIYSQLGANESRLNDESMKVACTYFQCSAGAYQYLRDNFNLDSFPDMLGDILQLKAVIMLGQAQECLLEKSVRDNRKNTLIARIAMQIKDYFQEAVNLLQGEGTSEMGSSLRKSWTKHLQIKIFTSCVIAYIYMSNEADQDKKFGDKVSYLKAASSKMNEAMKLSKNQPEQVLENLKFLNDVVGNKLEAAVKENDFVYHASVPEIDKMPEIKGVCLVKAMQFQYDDPSVSGPDIFQRLIPMRAHEASSLYSEEKASVLREITKKIEEKDLHLSESLSSMDIDDLLNPVDESLPDNLLEIRKKFMEHNDVVATAAGQLKELAAFNEEFDNILNDISAKINEEEQFEKQAKVIDSDSGLSSELENLKKEFTECKDVNQKARETNALLSAHFNDSKGITEFLIGPEEKLMSSLPSQNVIQSSTDEPVVQRMRELLAAIDKMKSQRKHLEQQFREQIRKDDITSLLVIKDDRNREELFKEQLKKHDELKAVIEQNLNAQDGILTSLTEANAKYAPTRMAAYEIKSQRDDQVKSYLDHAKLFEQVKEMLERGVPFHKNLKETFTKLLKKVDEYSQKREKEKKKFAELKKREGPPSRPVAAKPTFDRASKPAAMQSGPPQSVPGSMYGPQIPDDVRRMPPGVPGDAMHIPRSNPGLNLPPGSQPIRPMGQDGAIMQPRMPNSFQPEMQPRFIPQSTIPPRFTQSDQAEMGQLPPCTMQPRYRPPGIIPTGQDLTMHGPIPGTTGISQPSISNYQLPQVPPQGQRFPVDKLPPNTDFQNQGFRIQDSVPTQRFVNQIKRTMLIDQNQRRFGAEQPIRPTLPQNFEQPIRPVLPHVEQPVRPLSAQYRDQSARQALPQQVDPSIRPALPQQVDHIRPALPQHVDHIRPAFPQHAEQAVRPGQVLGQHIDKPFRPGSPQHVRPPVLQQDPNIPQYSMPRPLNPIQPQASMQFRPQHDRSAPHGEQRMPFTSPAMVSGVSLPPLNAPSEHVRFSSYGNVMRQADYTLKPQGQVRDPQFHPVQNQPRQQIMQPQTSLTGQYSPRSVQNIPSRLNMPPQQQMTNLETRQPAQGYVRQDLAPGAMLARQDSGSRPEVLQPRFNPAGNQAVPFNPATGQFPPRQFSSQEQYRHPTLPEPLQPQLRLPEPLMPSKIGQDLVDTREQSSDPRMPGVLREPDRSLMQNVSPGPLGNQMFPEGQERKPDPIHPGQQLVQPLQPTPLGDSTFRQEPFVRDNESSMQQLRYSADLTGAPQARQPQNQIPDEIRGQPNIAPRGTVSQYVTMQSNTVQNNQYAFQGPISTSRPASMGGDVSIVSTMNLERSYETPSAPPQQVSMPSPGVRNYPPFSPTQVFDPITMNNRPVMAATRSADSVLSGILGNAGSVQGVKANQSDAMQLGMQQFQIQQLFMQQQQLISMIQNQQNQQKQTESLQIEKLQNQLVDQQRYIIQLANEQQKLQHKQESATEDYSHLLIAQFEQKINEQSKQLLEQQKELQQLQVKNIKTPLVISSNDPPVIKSSSADVDTSGNQKLAAEVISESAYPSMLTSLDLSEKSSARENKEQSNIDLKLAGLIVTCTDTPSGDQISISSEKPDTVRHTEDSKCSPLVVKPETLSDSFSDDKKPSEVTSGEKEQLKADLDQFEQEMDAVLSGAVSNTLTTPTSKESNVHSSMEKASGDEAILKDLLVGPTERQVKAGGNASQEGGGTEDVFVTKNEDAVPFYEPMLDKEQSVRSRQITSSNSSKSDSSIPLNEDNVSQEKDTLNKEHKEESKSGELNLGEDIIKDKSMAEDSSTVTSELVDAISEESLPKNTEDSFESAVKTSTESTLNALTGLDALKLPEHPTILPTVDTNEKIDSAENEIKLDTTKSTDVPSASCKGDLGGSSSPISITVDSNTLSPELGVSPPRPHLNRQQGRLSFLQTQEEDDVRKAYLEDLDAAVDRLHEQCMELCKKQRGVPVDGFTQMWNDLAQVEELDSCSFTTNAGIQNANKNRYRDILPYDHTRVLLKSLPNDYINASHISKLTPLSPHYIASQGPIPQCFEDFWTMVWEQDCSVIVMLTNEVEGSKLKCHPYWPRKLEQTAEYGHMAVYLMEQEAGPSWKSRKFLVTNLKVNDSRMVTQLQFTAWPDYGIPNTPYDLLSFFEEVHRCYSTLNAKAKNPLLLHCSAGVGRTGTFSCIYSAIEEINGGNGLVEVPGLVRKLRQCRFHMVQRKEQLVFCYQAILCYAQQYLAEEQMKEDSKNSRSVSVSQLEDEVMVQLNQAEKEASAEEFHQHVENIPADIVKYDSKGETWIEKSTEDQLLKIDLSTKTLDTSSDSGHLSGGTGAILQKPDTTLVGDYKSAAANPDEMKSSHEEPHHSRDRADSIPKFKVRSDIFSSRSPPPSPGVPNIPSDNDSDHT